MPMLFKKLNNSFDKDLRYEGYRLISVDGEIWSGNRNSSFSNSL